MFYRKKEFSVGANCLIRNSDEVTIVCKLSGIIILSLIVDARAERRSVNKKVAELDVPVYEVHTVLSATSFISII